MEAREDRLTGESVARKPRVKPRSSTASERREVPDEPHQDERDESEVDHDVVDQIREDELFKIFEQSVDQSILPPLPSMPGYHTCWLTTTNNADPVAHRLRIGYELIRSEWLPGWDARDLQSGAYPGVVGLREMVAARIPTSLYLRYMELLHHTGPLTDEEKIKAKDEAMKEHLQAAGSGILEEGDGTANLVKRAGSKPKFPT